MKRSRQRGFSGLVDGSFVTPAFSSGSNLHRLTIARKPSVGLVILARERPLQCEDNRASQLACVLTTFQRSRVIDHLRDVNASGTGVYATYLYCDYQRTGNYPVTALVGALLRQLLGQFDSLPDKVAEVVRLSHIKLRRPTATIEEMYRVLEPLAPLVKRLFVCIDALDECGDAEHLLTLCREFPLPTSFFFIGRQSITSMVKRVFPDAEVQTIQPQNADIYAVVSEQVEHERARQPELLPPDLAYEIQEDISALANGM